MVEGFAWLLLADLVGECARSLFGLPVPGPVIGLFVLAIAIAGRRRIIGRRRIAALPVASGESPTERTANALITHMGLLFVPAGVGILAVAPRLHGAWIALGVALIVSTGMTLAVTGGVMHIFRPRAEPDPPGRTTAMKSDRHV